MTKKILIVDDERDLLRVMTMRLTKAGYEIMTATDGREALVLIEEAMPDLVLLDLRLPVMSGQDVCKKMKSDPKFKNIPIILFTASAGGDIPERARALGADDYIIKPFEAEDLLKKIARLIQR